MPPSLYSLDWTLVRAFLAVAETGSLSAAARRLGTSQPTIGRQVQALEDALGAELFRRQPRGMELTATGAEMLAPAQAMQAAAGQIALRAAGQSEALAGTVRITASIFTAHHVLPPIIAGLRRDEPEIMLEIVASDQTENLLFREADIAIRMYRPEQLDVVTQHLGDYPLGVFAAKSYLDRVGRPTDLSQAMAYDFVGYDRNEEILRGFRDHGMDVDREFFPTRCDHQSVYWEFVRSGCGIGFGLRQTGLADPLLEEINLGIPIPVVPVWLTAHEAMRRTPRIRRVWDRLSEALTALLP
ncbi:MAG: LysR family transcriptional regulator [Rhodobacteraceae bacterium]|nr:LysR family transcriptional regulator [Paracoccaceae bacterium]